MTRYFLILLSFSCVLINQATAQDLQQKIDLEVKDKTMEEVFEHLNREYDLALSYMNNELPKQPITVYFEDQTIGDVLRELLKDSNLEYMEHGTQIIIKRKADKKQIKETTQTDKPTKQDSLPDSIADAFLADSSKVDIIEPDSISTNEQKNDSIMAESNISDVSSKSDSARYAGVAQLTIKGNQKQPEFLELPVKIKEKTTVPDSTVLEDSIKVQEKEHKLFHLGVLFPISTNGFIAGQYINNISLHLIAGRSGGLNGFEYSTIANVVNGDMNGMQFTGFANVVKNNATGSQLAGAVNVVENDFQGLQIAGATNVIKGNHIGLQAAFATNVSTGSFAGFQATGGVNVAKGNIQYGQIAGGLNIANQVQGPQLAGFMNIQKRQGNGLQLAGFMNMSGNYNGLQAAGFLNTAEKINGLQVAGFLNMAENVNGVQIGLINIADSLSGVPIGLFSLVKRNGYLDLELFYAEDFQANAIIKVGAPKFHNLFGFSYEMDYKKRWAYGYGFGSQWGKRAFRINTDLITYYVIEQEFPDGAFKDYEVNLLSKFRMLGSLHHHNFGIFAGPVFNVMVSRIKDAETEKIGSDIAPDPLFESTNRFGTNVKIWIGYNVGIRF